MNKKRRPTKEELKTKFRLRFLMNLANLYENNIILVSEYRNNRDKHIFKCKIHDYEFESRPTSVLSGHSCPKCKGRNKIKSIQEHIEYLRLEKNIELIGNPRTIFDRVTFRCLIDNHTWESCISSLRDRGCAKCKGLSKLTNEEFISRVKDKNLGIKPIDKYINTKTKIRFICDHGHIFESTPNTVLSAGRGCPICKMSSEKL